MHLHKKVEHSSIEAEIMDGAGDKRVEVNWLSLLPMELWAHIAKQLNSTLGILRFRSTCRRWRSVAPPPPRPSSKSLFPPQITIPHGNLALVQTKIYGLQPSSSTAPDSCYKGTIIMVGDSKRFPLRLLDPFTNSPVSPKPRSRKRLNLMDFRFVELVEAYSLTSALQIRGDEEEERAERPEVLKVIVFPGPASGGARLVFALYKDDETLRVSEIGDGNWAVLVLDDDDGNYHSSFDDMIVRMGQLYVVDKWGTILWVDCSSLKLVQFSPTLRGFGKKKHLVECGGSLYVVDMYIEEEPIGVRVYRLDEEWGRWLDVKNLGHDVVFVLGKDSNFCVSARDYYGCEGNCVYFCYGGKVSAFSLKTNTFKSPDVFWPCPSLFDHQTMLFLSNPVAYDF